MKHATAHSVSEIHQWLDELENAVITAEQALRTREWRDLGESISEQRRSTHGISNAIDSAGTIPTIERVKIDLRVRAILARRASQIQRLEDFHTEVGRRLRELTKYKFALREMETDPIALAIDVER